MNQEHFQKISSMNSAHSQILIQKQSKKLLSTSTGENKKVEELAKENLKNLRDYIYP